MKVLPQTITQKWIFWDGDVEVQTYKLERKVVRNKHIVAYTHTRKAECLEVCIGNSSEECDAEMLAKLSTMIFINNTTLADKRFERPWLSNKN